MRHHIARKLAFLTILSSSVIALLLTGMQLFNDFFYEKGELDKHLEFIKTSRTGSLVESLWIFHDKQIVLELEGITNHPSVVFAEITEKGRTKVSTGVRPTDNFISREVSLSYGYPDEDDRFSLGELHIYATLDNIYSRLLDKGHSDYQQRRQNVSGRRPHVFSDPSHCHPACAESGC